MFIHERAVIGNRAEIYPEVIINTGAQVDHQSIIQDCARIYPGVVLAENVIIGECSIVHTVATIINKIRVGANPIIGAGAVIIKDIPGKIIKCFPLSAESSSLAFLRGSIHSML